MIRCLWSARTVRRRLKGGRATRGSGTRCDTHPSGSAGIRAGQRPRPSFGYPQGTAGPKSVCEPLGRRDVFAPVIRASQREGGPGSAEMRRTTWMGTCTRYSTAVGACARRIAGRRWSRSIAVIVGESVVVGQAHMTNPSGSGAGHLATAVHCHCRVGPTGCRG